MRMGRTKIQTSHASPAAITFSKLHDHPSKIKLAITGFSLQQGNLQY